MTLGYAIKNICAPFGCSSSSSEPALPHRTIVSSNTNFKVLLVSRTITKNNGIKKIYCNLWVTVNIHHFYYNNTCTQKSKVNFFVVFKKATPYNIVVDKFTGKYARRNKVDKNIIILDFVSIARL